MLRAEPAPTATASHVDREGWFERVLVVAAVLVLMTGYSTVIEGRDWIITTTLVVALVTTAAVVLRLLGLRRTVTPIVLVVELIVLAWVFVPRTLIVVIPTLDTFRGFTDLVSKAGPTIVEEQAPVAASASIVLLIAAAFGAIVVLADALLRLRRGVPLVGVLLLAVYVTPGLISGVRPGVLPFLLTAAVWLALLRRRTGVSGPVRQPRQAPALVLGVGGLVAALAFPLVSPDISSVAASWGKPPPQVFGRGINPMVELGTNLRRNSAVTVLTYSSSLDDPPYLKVATLPDFTGRTWRPAAQFGEGRFEGQLSISDDVEAEPATTRVRIEQLRSELIPVPYPAVEIGGLQGGYRVERTGLTVQSRQGSADQTYTVQSLDVQPTAEQLRAAPRTTAPGFRQYLRTGELPRIITDTAREVTADATNDYDRALALQSYFRSSAFTYSETAPVAQGYDGNGIDVIAQFLRTKSGYCVHFSSSMAVMARSLGIPARIAVGYAPGTSAGQTGGQETYRVQSDDLHAWTELYFEGAGWLRFDPTPGIGSSTSFVEPAQTDTGDTGDTESAPDQRNDQTNPQERTDSATPEAAAEEESGTAGRSSLAVLVAIAAMVLLPGAGRRGLREWRLRRGDVDAVWREVESSARDLGIDAARADTPRGFADRLRVQPGVDVEALDRLLEQVERSRYSRDGATDGGGTDARRVIDSLAAHADRRTSWRARLLPRSFSRQPLQSGT